MIRPRPAFPSSAAQQKRTGFSMVELMLVIVVAGILMTMGVPKSSTTLANAEVNKATAEMQSIWLSQRRYRMEYGTFAPSMRALVQEGFMSEVLLKKREPFQYTIEAKSRGRLKITATRTRNGSWRGSFTLNEMGEMKGELANSEGKKIEP